MRWARKHLDGIVPYVPGKAPEALARELGVPEALKLASNESPVGPSPHAIHAIRKALDSLHRYPDNDAFALRERVADRHGIATDEIVFGHGTNEIIDLLCRTVVGPEDHALCGSPSFVAYALGLRVANVPFTEVPMRARVFWNPEAVLEALRPETRLVFLDNPNNPTSTHIPSTGLRDFLRAVPEHVTVVLDEAYEDFVDAADYTSGLELRSLHERLVVLRTFSKAHGLAALRIGYGVAPAPMVEYLNRVRLPFNTTSVAQAAAIASLDDLQHVAQYVADNRGQRARLIQALQDLGVTPAPSQTNFVTAPFGPLTGRLYNGLMREGVIVREIAPPLNDWLRISIGLACENDRLLAALARLYQPESV